MYTYMHGADCAQDCHEAERQVHCRPEAVGAHVGVGLCDCKYRCRGLVKGTDAPRNFQDVDHTSESSRAIHSISCLRNS